MKRTIVTAAPLAPAALAELKDWLGIAVPTTGEDAGLTALLRAALDSCEAFTGTLPLQAGCEELVDGAAGWPGSGWLVLSSRPVQAITAVQAAPAGAPRTDLPAAAYAIDLGAEGTGRVRLLAPVTTARCAVRYTAGLAPDWASLPDGLRHGIVRLAAHHYRLRDTPGEGPQPPAAVAALWRPWRTLRLR